MYLVAVRTINVTAPDETRWSVRVVWEPRWRVLARRFGGWRAHRRGRRVEASDVVDGAAQMGDVASSGSGDGDLDFGDAILAIVVVFIVFIAAAVLFWWVLLPLLLVILDGFIILILLFLSIVGRVLFRRPWTVQATADDGKKVTAQVVGWRSALRRRDDIADSLRHGLRPDDIPSPLRR